MNRPEKSSTVKQGKPVKTLKDMSSMRQKMKMECSGHWLKGANCSAGELFDILHNAGFTISTENGELLPTVDACPKINGKTGKRDPQNGEHDCEIIVRQGQS